MNGVELGCPHTLSEELRGHLKVAMKWAPLVKTSGFVFAM